MIRKYGIIVVLVLIIIALLVAPIKRDEKKILYYKNPMDPSITSPVFKKDEMGMDYIPVYAQENVSEKPKEGIALPENHANLLSIKLAPVKRISLTSTLTAAGSVAYDPELFIAQEEYLQALRAQASQSRDDDASQILHASRQKLLLAGMTVAQVDALARKGYPDKNLYQPIANGSVWVYFNVFEKDAGLVKAGQTVSIEAVGLPGKTFQAIVRGLTPVIDADTRSLRARAEVPGAAGQLKPGMYITAKVSAHGDLVIAVSEDAVMDTGTRTLVYVEVEKGRFASRSIRTGRRFNGQIEILSGLKAGETVVAEGNFFIDSESKLQGK